MSTKQDLAVGREIKRGASTMSNGSTLRRPRPSTPPGRTIVETNQVKPRGLARSSSMAEDQLSKHIPNYMKPTISSMMDVRKIGISKKLHSHDDLHKPHNPTLPRRRSLDRLPVPASQAHKAINQSLNAKPAGTSLLKKRAPPVVKPAASTERVSKVVKAVRSQTPLLRTKSLPKSAGFKMDVNVDRSSERKTMSGLKKAAPTKDEEVPNIEKSEVEVHESFDVNVEEEQTRMENNLSAQDLLTHEKHYENDNDENHNPAESLDDTNQEKLNSADAEQDHAPEPIAETIEDAKVSIVETQIVVSESQHVDETEQPNNRVNEEAPAEDDIRKEEEIKSLAVFTVKPTLEEVPAEDDTIKEEEETKPLVGLIVKTTKKEAPAEDDTINEEEEIKPLVGLTVKTILEEAPAEDETIKEEEEIKPLVGLTVKTTLEEAPAEEDTIKEEEEIKPFVGLTVKTTLKEAPPEEDTIKEEQEIKPIVGLTVKTTLEEAPAEDDIIKEEEETKPLVGLTVQTTLEKAPAEDDIIKEEEKIKPLIRLIVQTTLKEAPAEDDTIKEEKEITIKEEGEIKPLVGLTVKTTQEETTIEDDIIKEEEIKPLVGLTVKTTLEEAPAEEDTVKEKEDIKPLVGLTIKTALEEAAENEDQGSQTLKNEDEVLHKIDEEKEKEKQAAKLLSGTGISVVHKRHIGGPVKKKESPAYNDVIEETASKLVGDRINKVRALAGAFETVISLEHSS